MSNTQHEALERRVSSFTIDHAYPEIVAEEIAYAMKQFKLVDRVRRLKSGQSVNISIRRCGEQCWGDYVAIRMDDPCAPIVK